VHSGDATSRAPTRGMLVGDDPPARRFGLRPASSGDIERISDIWHRGWRDGHLGRVPAPLLRHRRPQDFLALVPPRLERTTVATLGPVVVGFVTVHDDEVEQVYVDDAARGGGVADALLAHSEAVICARRDRAWLAVVAGNARARRFYERNGWSNFGGFDNPAPVSGGAPIAVPALCYEKGRTPSDPGPQRRDERLDQHRQQVGRQGTSRYAQAR